MISIRRSLGFIVKTRLAARLSVMDARFAEPMVATRRGCNVDDPFFSPVASGRYSRPPPPPGNILEPSLIAVFPGAPTRTIAALGLELAPCATRTVACKFAVERMCVQTPKKNLL